MTEEKQDIVVRIHGARSCPMVEHCDHTDSLYDVLTDAAADIKNLRVLLQQAIEDRRKLADAGRTGESEMELM